MNELERAKARYQKKYGKLAPEIPTVPSGNPAPKESPEKREVPVLLEGQPYKVPKEKKEGLRLVIDVRGLGRTETFNFFHPNPEAFVAWQEYKNLREVLRMALNTKLPGIR